MTKQTVTIVLFCAASLLAQNRSRAGSTAMPWKPLEFLIGTWEARTQGGEARTQGESAGAVSFGTYSFQLELRGHVLARHSSTAGCQGPANFNCEHGDLLYVYRETPGQAYKAIYFDNEGHVIHYDVSTPTPDNAIFLSSPTEPGPQFKLSYERKGSILFGKFQMRMPGQVEFKSYLEWDGGRKN